MHCCCLGALRPPTLVRVGVSVGGCLCYCCWEVFVLFLFLFRDGFLSPPLESLTPPAILAERARPFSLPACAVVAALGTQVHFYLYFLLVQFVGAGGCEDAGCRLCRCSTAFDCLGLLMSFACAITIAFLVLGPIIPSALISKPCDCNFFCNAIVLSKSLVFAAVALTFALEPEVLRGGYWG